MFTDRFIKLPSKLFNKKNSDLTGKEELFDCEIKLLPSEIYEYYETLDDDDILCTQIWVKNGDPFMVYLLIDEFEKRLNEHQK